MVAFDTGHADLVNDVQMDYYGKRVVTCSSDKMMKIFDIVGTNHVLVAQLAGHEGPVWRAAWAHPMYGTLLASCSYDRRVIVWREERPGSWSRIFEDASAQQGVQAIGWAPHAHGLTLAAGSADGQVSVFTYTQQKMWDHKRFPANQGGVLALSWCQATGAGAVQRFATGGCDAQLMIWAYSESDGLWLAQRAFVDGHCTHNGWIRDVSWSSATLAATVATASDDCTVGVWREDAHSRQWARQATIGPFAVAACRVSWSESGDILGVTTVDGATTLWKEAADGRWAEVGRDEGTPVCAPQQQQQQVVESI